MKTTPINAWPVAQDTDPVKQYPAAVDDPFKASLDTRVVPRFATAAARATAIPTPTLGMLSWLNDTNRYEYFDNTSWQPVTMSRAAYSGTMNAAWSGSCQSIISAGTLFVSGQATTGNALINTWYDFATLPTPARPLANWLTGSCWVSGYAGLVDVQPGGLVRINTGQHPSGATEARFLLAMPWR